MRATGQLVIEEMMAIAMKFRNIQGGLEAMLECSNIFL